jgi:hypothetical protein
VAHLQSDPHASVLADGTRIAVKARRANPEEEAALWHRFARFNPGFDEYRSLTERPIPIVILEPQP